MNKQLSGKLVIVGILGVALAAAGTSWWFRYSATRRAAEFWGPRASMLIRNATLVELIELAPSAELGDTSGAFVYTVVLGDESYFFRRRFDVSNARGLVHLRHALLEDRSFNWPSRDDIPDADWRWGLRFTASGSGPFVLEQSIWFSSNCRYLMPDGRTDETGRIISCQPIAAGLCEMFAEMSTPSVPAPR
jgi:hypothetical protein